MSKKGKQLLFSLDEFLIMIAWLGALFAILYFEAYEFIIPSVAAFIILNLALGLWINKFVHPIENKSYRQYLTIQTLFLVVWGPLLALILGTGRNDLIVIWMVILVVFYLGIGIVSLRKMLREMLNATK